MNQELRVLAVALAIGLDVFALSIAVGIKGAPWRERLRLGAAFSFAEISMQVLGLALGTGSGRVAGEVASWVGLLLLAGIGVWILREGFSDEEGHDLTCEPPADSS